MKTRKISNLVSLTLIAILVTTATSCSKVMDSDFRDGATGPQAEEQIRKDPMPLLAGAIDALRLTEGDGSSVDANSIMSIQHAGDLMTEDVVQRQDSWHYFDYDIDNGNNQATYRRVRHSWGLLYGVAGKANEVIELVDFETTDPIRQNRLGQALALRAFAYHTLIQRFQQTYLGNEDAPGIPMILTERDTDEKALDGTPGWKNRGTVRKVYAQIEKDLLLAVELLDHERLSKDFINKAVAQGLLARVYMTMGKWAEAETMAAEARVAFPIMSAGDAGSYGYNSQDNQEWMWGSSTTMDNRLIYWSFQSIISSDADGYAGLGAFKAMDSRLYDQMGPNDARRNLHHDDRTPGDEMFYNKKFKNVPSWLMDNIYMRSSEMLLIEAEAQARQGRGGDAAATLMELMGKRDPDYSRTTANVEDIFLQKRIECWGEGVIFYDYRRLRRAVDRTYTTPFNNHLIRVAVSGTAWRVIYQIPEPARNASPELAADEQNPAS
ncbi:MAG: RagB/SusD family nutrient uptake outer membrane protein [Bacteroidales bacterium]|nr:RagB/SusD family nutrient uptake outer membrane protein [Bacteroidales bacterium]